MKVINLYAGPGSGKSTTAAGLFHVMKLMSLRVELVTEYAKELVWDQQYSILSDQLQLLAEQHRRVSRLVQHGVEWVVTDSPILLNLAYVVPGYFQNFPHLVEEIHNSYDNINFFIKRVKPYETVGRTQSFEQAQQKDDDIRDLLQKYNQSYIEVNGDHTAVTDIIGHLKI